MRFRNLSNWRDPKSKVNLLFFAQRAEELLFDYSLDSYKAPALNSVYLCKEALDILEDVENGVVASASLAPVLEELSLSISRDKVAKSLLDMDKSYYIIDFESEKLSKVKLRLEVLGKTLNFARYLDRCKFYLAKAVKQGGKKDIDSFSGLFFTTLINCGVHKNHLYEQTSSFFFGNGHPCGLIDSNECIDRYLEVVSPKRHEFDVFFLASSLLNDVKNSTEEVFKLEFLDEVSEDVKDLAGRQNFSKGRNEVIVKAVSIKAFDFYSAREIADARLSKVRDVFTLYHHKNQINWKDKALVYKKCCDMTSKAVSKPTNPIEKISDQRPKKASQSLNRMLKSFRMVEGDFKRFARVVDFHGLSVNSEEPENQLVNLWISLETLIPSYSGSATIRQVLDSIMPFLAINYLRRLIDQVLQDLLRWNRREVIKHLKQVKCPSEASLRRKMLMLLFVSENEEIKVQLYEKLKDFHLLRYRVYSLTEGLASPKKALEFLKSHERKVGWQIRRIYRTRNLIVHSGVAPKYINSLIENGHDYLDQVIFIITNMVGGEYKIKTMNQAFELASLYRDKIERSFKDIDVYSDETFEVLLGEHDFMHNI